MLFIQDFAKTCRAEIHNQESDLPIKVFHPFKVVALKSHSLFYFTSKTGQREIFRFSNGLTDIEIHDGLITLYFSYGWRVEIRTVSRIHEFHRANPRAW